MDDPVSMMATLPGTSAGMVGWAVPVWREDSVPTVGAAGAVAFVVLVVREPAPVVAVLLTPTCGEEQAARKRPTRAMSTLEVRFMILLSASMAYGSCWSEQCSAPAIIEFKN
jgi:hypothetical protein